MEYLERDDLAQVPPNRDGELPEPKKGMAIDAGVQLDLTDAVAEEHVTAVVSAVRMLETKPASAPTVSKPAVVAPATVARRRHGCDASQHWAE